MTFVIYVYFMFLKHRPLPYFFTIKNKSLFDYYARTSCFSDVVNKPLTLHFPSGV